MRQAQLRAVLGFLHRVAHSESGPGDAQLLDRWRQQRDPAAFEVLVWRHGAMVWNVCRRVLGREQDVEDAFQATFLTFLRKADTIGQGRFLGSWLYKVAYRTALAARTTSVRHTVYEPLDADFPEAATLTEDGWHKLAPVLDEEISRLPEKYRRPFVLCYVEGKTTDEVAEDLGCPRGTVGSRLAWARERLRSRLTRRGVALSATGLATLLAEKTAVASVPAPLVANIVKAATLSEASVISARAVVLSEGVLRALFLTKLKVMALALLVVATLGSGVGVLAHQALAQKTERMQTADRNQPAGQVPPNRDIPDRPDEEDVAVAQEDRIPAAPGKDGTSDPRPIAGTVVRVDTTGKGLGLKIPSKVAGQTSLKDIRITDQTQLLFSNVGPNEARLMEGYAAQVWLEKGTNVAVRVHLNGHQNPKKLPQMEGQVVAVAADGKGITLEKRAKAEPVERIAIKFTDWTRVSFTNVARDGARMTVGSEVRVWLEKESANIAKSVTFFGTAEGKPAGGKDPKADLSGRIVGVSGDGQVLTVEMSPTKDAEPTRTAIRLTDATRESYHTVAAERAEPLAGYRVQVWLADGSQDTAARVRFFGNDPRQSVDARILAMLGERLTLAMSPAVKGGEPTQREITITPKTQLVFFNVGAGGASLTEGYHVRGWLVLGLEGIADELILSRSEKTDDREPGDKKLH